VAKISKRIHRLFLRLLNFMPALLAKTQGQPERLHASIDVLIRDAWGKHLKDLKVTRQEERQEERQGEKEAEMREYARLLLRAHFAEDRNECLTEDAIRRIGE